jgi:hypothetical protein
VFEDSSLRVLIYDHLLRTCKLPSIADLADQLVATGDEVRTALRRLHDAHMLVLQPNDEILMANPFSAVPTPFVTEVANRRWFGNCIWDALGIIAALHPRNPKANGRVLTACGSSSQAMELRVREGILEGQGIVHFALPARRWWDDIVFN